MDIGFRRVLTLNELKSEPHAEARSFVFILLSPSLLDLKRLRHSTRGEIREKCAGFGDGWSNFGTGFLRLLTVFFPVIFDR